MIPISMILSVVIATSSALACGSGDAGVAKATGTSSAQGKPGRIEPCKLLTDEQVRTVVPDLKGSFVASAGESLMKDVDAYQCSYVNATGAGLLVVLNVAANDASFAAIRGSSDRYADAQKLDLGDAAWVFAKDDDLNVTVHKGRTVIELTLNNAQATQQTKALTDLARAVTAKIS